MVCRNQGRAEAAKDEIVERSKNQVRNVLHVDLSWRRDPDSAVKPQEDVSLSESRVKGKDRGCLV